MLEAGKRRVVKSFRDLEVYQLAYRLTMEVFEMTTSCFINLI